MRFRRCRPICASWVVCRTCAAPARRRTFPRSEAPAGLTNHDFKRLFNPDEISQFPAYLRIVGGLQNVRRAGPPPDINGHVFTSAKQKFKVETVAKGLNQPWGAAFLPDGRMIFTERDGKLRFMSKDGKLSDP